MAQNTKNIIEINGKRYDAVSGSYLGSGTMPIARPKPSLKATSGRAVDGFIRSQKPNAQSSAQPKTTPAAPGVASVTKPAPKLTRPLHAPAAHVRPHKPEPSKTLMRSAVRKPSIKSPATIKAQTRTDILASVPKRVVAPKLSHASIDPQRQKKAMRIIQSPAVSRYGNIHDFKQPAHPSSLTPASQHPAISPPHSKRPTTSQNATSMDNFRLASSANRKTHTPNIPVTAENRQLRTPQPDIFEQAMASAVSHQQTYNDEPKARTGRRFTGLATVSMCLLLIAGIIAYFNVPTLSMEMASTRAGIDAKLPGYSPAGYSFGGLTYSPGNVTVNYKSDQANQAFDITQRSSDWDSEALLSNFVSSANDAYQTYERAGRTIYFFGNNTATWVDSGIWYTVNGGNSSMDKNQLLDLAGSM